MNIASLATDTTSDSKFTLFVGGSVGNDPYDPRTWSGSALHLVRALQGAQALDQAIGLSLPQWLDLSIKAKNVSPSRRIWRLKFYLDSSYRNALTQSAKQHLARLGARSSLLQIGAMYNLARATGHTVPCYSYHDGNIFEALKSGYGFVGVPARRIDEAIQYEREVAHDMTAVFTFSGYLRKSFIEDFGLDEKKVFNVGGGVNIEDLPVLTENKIYNGRDILFVGVDFDRKGGNELLSAFQIVQQALPDARLHIVGPLRLPLSGPHRSIFFYGNLNKSVPEQRDKLYRLYNQASVFVLPSKYEPFGVAPLEAMLFSVPCIVTNGWALREFVTDGVNGALVEKGSVESLVAALLKLLRDPGKLSEMGQAAREIVLRTYAWPRVAAKMKAAAAMIQ